MQQARMRRQGNEPAARPRPAAQIHIIVTDRQALIEAAEFLEPIAADKQTGPGDGGHRTHLAELRGNSLARKTAMRVLPSAVRQWEYAGVLQRAVRIKECGADDADVRMSRRLEQALEPVRVQHFDVIVEKEE